ncbi:MAG: PorT family protein [Acidobacteria bacterium]|jgi:opacity protein-like surface antigen|nr:PorT family protein [Acidobacteriota bacterium]
MKRMLSATVLLLLLAPAAPASEIKALLGMHSSKYLFSDEVAALSRKQKSGLVFGLGYGFAIAERMELEAEIVYGEKGAKTELAPVPGTSVSGIYRNTSITVPLLFKYKLKEGASPYAALGPAFVFILSHHLEIPALGTSFDISDNTKKFVLGFNALLGYELPLGSWRLCAELRFDRWLGNFLVDPAAAARSESVALMIGGAYSL